MSEFLFVYRGGRRPESPEQGQQIMQKWVTWLKSLAESGNLKDGGHPLDYTGNVVRARNSVTDGPYAESKDLVGGYSIVEARDLAHATELSFGCPTFESGGFVEVRPIMKM